jgi:hypothetical protein
MEKYYKLTNKNLQTHKGCQWVVGEWKETSGEGILCDNGWLHCYHHPLLAVLYNPIHANIENPLLWEVEVDGNYLNDNFIKCGFTKMRLIRQIELPKVTTIQRVAFAIYCSLEVCKNKEHYKWAENWLNGTDRSEAAAEAAAEWAVEWAAKAEAAEAAAEAAEAAKAARAAAKAAEWAAVEAAKAEAAKAEAAAKWAAAKWAAAKAAEWAAAKAAEWAAKAEAAEAAARAAVEAAKAARAAANELKMLLKCARKAMKII